MATAEESTKTEPPAKATVVSPVPRKKKTKRAYIVLAALMLAVVAVYFIHGFLTKDQVSTDDAQIDADVVPVSARVAGVVLHMKVEDNQKVEAGGLTAAVGPADYAAKVAAAQTDLEAANAQAEAADAQVDIVKSTS